MRPARAPWLLSHKPRRTGQGAERKKGLMTIYIPENDYGIQEGSYPLNNLVQLLRDHKDNPDTIQFLADMLEK